MRGCGVPGVHGLAVANQRQQEHVFCLIKETLQGKQIHPQGVGIKVPVEGNILKLVEVEPVVFNEKTVIVKGLEDGLEIVSKPVAGAYSGMEVTVFESQGS